ncbi:MAG: hypothetical protein HY859_06455 [Caulobacterales bacterium]|nr:hypothetical protein [Caulobacterales bacterium]
MGRLFKVLAVLCLLLAATATPSAPSHAQPYVDLDANQAVQTVQGLINRMNAEAAKIRAHRFTPPPPYYDEPCEPTKMDAERSLAPYRVQRRALVAEMEALKARILVLERVSSSAIVLSNNGWKVHDQNRFRSLEQALRALDQAMAAKEAELDAIKSLPCRRAQPTTPTQPRDPDGPLTPGEEAQFEDFPLTPPVFDDPVVMPTPPKFCTYAERRAWMDRVYWPTVERAKQNALKAIDTFGKAEARLRDVRDSDRPDSPRIALAEQAVRFWRAEKDRRMAEQQRLLAIDVPNPVDCETPRTTTGATSPTPPTTPQPPATDGPMTTTASPLPPGFVRPQLERVNIPTPPKELCSEAERSKYLVEVYHPAADAASKNALKTSAYRKLLSDRIYEATVTRDGATAAALKREYEAFKPIADEADALQQRMMRMRDEILKIPLVDCTNPGRPRVTPPVTTPPPPTDTGLEEMIIEAGPIRPEAGPRLPPPALARPQFEVIREFTVPTKFCSAQERNDFLNNVYNPAVASALANARTAQAHQAKLNALFTEHMKANSPHWAAVRAERDAYEAITNEALAKSGALNDLYLKILAVPIVPCDKPETTTPPPAVTPGRPVMRPTVGIGVEPPPLEGGTTELGGVIFPEIHLPPLPDTFCEGEQQQAEKAADKAMQTVEDNEQRVLEYTAELEEEIKYYTARGDTARAEASRSKLHALKDIAERVARDRAAVEAYRAAIKTRGRYCPPPTDGPGVAPPPAPVFKEFSLIPRPANLCDPNVRRKYLDDLHALYDQILAAQKELTAYYLRRQAAAIALGRYGMDPDLLMIEDQLDEYDDELDELEDIADDLIFGRLSLFKLCPPPVREEVPCPPKQARDPINVGPNSKVGSGARLRAKVGGMALGALAGALGGGGGGGGGSDGPDLWTCKIKDSEYTVFDDPVTGVSLKVGAKRAKGGKVVIFSEIARSPDKGTFQTAFLENPLTGETQAPGDVGPCDLWGEWKLTVSWTKTTYVDGQMVSRETGGWQKTGKFSIPGTLSKVDAPDGLWKRMGFSNASNGAREMGMIFDVPPGGGPLTFVIHVTRPKGDPVMTVPFVLTMAEGPNGFVFTKAEDPPCPPETIAIADGPRTGEAPLPPPEPALPPPPPPQGLPPWQVNHLPMVQVASSDNLQSMRGMIDEADKAPCPDGYKKVLDRIRWSRDEFRRMVPSGHGADSMRDLIDETVRRLGQMEDEVLAKMAASSCPSTSSVLKTDGPAPQPAPYTPPPGGSTGPRLPFAPPPGQPVSEPAKVDRFVSEARTADSGLARALEAAAKACPADPARSWTALRNRARAVLVARLMFLSSMRPMGPGMEQMTDAVAREFNRTMLLLQEVNALRPPPCAGLAPDQQPTEEETESILDDIEEKLVIG